MNDWLHRKWIKTRRRVLTFAVRHGLWTQRRAVIVLVAGYRNAAR